MQKHYQLGFSRAAEQERCPDTGPAVENTQMPLAFNREKTPNELYRSRVWIQLFLGPQRRIKTERGIKISLCSINKMRSVILSLTVLPIHNSNSDKCRREFVSTDLAPPLLLAVIQVRGTFITILLVYNVCGFISETWNFQFVFFPPVWK